ncbi:DNA translocase FtsK 4TM domain-containing protein [Halomonas sp. FME1]|uniref:DNA translocase FtsK n=2 Tax=Halomonas TaxID=2745 RepID=A0ABR9F4K5_9GAMM|nr:MULTISPECIES: DNA translocase FtsK 4TM domain-containing protein [Halomonas]MBE0400896.1 DNA translocase FtsK 4TM domain-containing protein [Halomonas casei]PCC23149.1 cell division protein FtsK [Halomonas sp. JB37]
MKVNKAASKRTQRNARQTPSSASSARVNAAKDKARRFGLRLQGSVRECVVVVLLALCVFLLLALFSYQPSDPGWSYQGPETDIRNWMGQVGAWLADVLYSLLGASALWWPGMFGFAAWWLIRSRQVRFELDPVAIAVHAGGLVLLMFGTTMLGALHFYHPNSMLPYASGGILGEGFVAALKPLVGSGGVGLIAAALILSGFPLFSGMSWLQVADELGKRICRLGGWFSARRQARRMRAAQRAAAKPAPAPKPQARTETPPPAEVETVATRPAVKAPAGRERREPGLSSAFSAYEPTADKTPDASPSIGNTTDTSIPWEAASLSSNKHVPVQSSAPAPVEPMADATPPSTPKAPRENAFAPVKPRAAEPTFQISDSDEPSAAEPVVDEPAVEEPEIDKPAVDEPSNTAAAFPLRASRQDASSMPATTSYFVNDEAPVEKQPIETPRVEPSRASVEPPVSEPEQRVSVSEPTPASERAAAIVPERTPAFERVAEVVPEPVWDDEDMDDELEEAPMPLTPPAASMQPASSTSAVPPVQPVQPQPSTMRREPTFAPEESAPETDEGPTLWTVEHLQSQRPAFETMDEPEGDVPSFQLLTPAEPHQPNYTEEQLTDMAELLEVRLREYGVKAEVVDTWPGPVITRFEIKPAAGVKVSKISNLAKDLARSLMVKSVRVVEVIPGRPTVGIEIPNPNRAMIRLREVIDSDRYQQETSPLTMALGQDIGGSPVVANLGKMPHLLVAGTTGSGKSVGVNAMLISMLLKAKPSELKLIMVDPKMLELSVYDGIPHLLAPVVTDMKEAANSLRWCVAEMERRYKLMAAMGVRNIAGFNGRLDEAERAGAQVADPLWEPQPWEIHQPHPVLEKLPYIVVVIDEFADMFMIVGKKVEELIARLAQKARAAGIHLILATQRPSVDVVTGLIKANIPSRMAFQVSSRIDSRTILDQGGAESLLGHGDMLYLPAGSGPPNRIHGAFVDDDEVHRVVDDWKRRGAPQYIEEILSGGVTADALTGLEADGVDGDDAEQDALYDEAVQFVTETRKASISAVQRRFKIGYNRAARLVDAMESAGVVTAMGSNGARDVLAPPPVGH